MKKSLLAALPLVLVGCVASPISPTATPALYELQTKYKEAIKRDCSIESNVQKKSSSVQFSGQMKVATNDSGWVNVSAYDPVQNARGNTFYNVYMDRAKCGSPSYKPRTNGFPQSWRPISEADALKLLNR